MKRHLWIVVLGLSGCVQYAQVQMDLVTQARKGIVLCQKSAQTHEQVIDRLSEIQQSRLDEAFDADVRETKSLTSDWIIQHRKAYTAALLILSRQHQDLQ